MKTSTKILIAVFVIYAIGLGVYDFKLKAEYVKGDYTDPYRDYIKFNFKDFDEVEVNASTVANVKLVQGPFKVMATPLVMDFLKITKEHHKLIINVVFPNQYRGISEGYPVYVSCPRLSSFSANAYYKAGNTDVTDTLARDLHWRPTFISGFTTDSLDITENYASNVVLENNTIKNLDATVGLSNKSGSALTIGQHNEFAKTNINVLNKSSLVIKSTGNSNINYRLADSASLIVNGAVVKHLFNTK